MIEFSTDYVSAASDRKTPNEGENIAQNAGGSGAEGGVSSEVGGRIGESVEGVEALGDKEGGIGAYQWRGTTRDLKYGVIPGRFSAGELPRSCKCSKSKACQDI